jgi:hypothetical protein
MQRPVNMRQHQQTCRQSLGNTHLTSHASRGKLLEAVSSLWSVSRLYSEVHGEKLASHG